MPGEQGDDGVGGELIQSEGMVYLSIIHAHKIAIEHVAVPEGCVYVWSWRASRAGTCEAESLKVGVYSE